jgi:hypothetical protein
MLCHAIQAMLVFGWLCFSLLLVWTWLIVSYANYDGDDIGVVGEHAGSPGVELLMGGQLKEQKDPLAVGTGSNEAHTVLSALGADFTVAASRTLVVKNNVIGSQAQLNLKRYLDEAHARASLSPDFTSAQLNDFKLSLSYSSLKALMGKDFDRAAAHFPAAGPPPNEIKLRRCSAHGECIKFHLDHSLWTMQIALNGDDEYSGGRLAFVTKSGFHVPTRPSGTMTIHNNTIVHGVTKIEAGIRYGLFFLRTTTGRSSS